ncbi:MAG: hypothetical protein ACK46X_00135 [Candidatus Sericytochromatia bacterium]
MPGKREAMALTIGIPLLIAAMSWAQGAFLAARGAPPTALWVAFEFSLAWLIVGLLSGHWLSGFRRPSLRPFLVCLALVPVVHLIGWGLSGPLGTAIAPRVPGVPRQMVEMSGYYGGIALMVAAVVSDLERAWQQREAEPDKRDSAA